MATNSNLNPTVEEIPLAVSRLHESFLERPVRDVEVLRDQLKALRASLEKNQQKLCDALNKDFHRSVMETMVIEYGCVVGEIDYFIRNLKSLLKPDGVDEQAASFSTLKMEVENIPLGTILIVVPFNYPLLLSLSPLIGALASGNNVVLKLPWDKCPCFCEGLTLTLLECIDPSRLSIINGGIPESSALLDQHFDLIMFTGSTKVGKIVAQKAVKYLTPTVLELGGKSPVFLTSNCKNLKKALARILWGKFSNAGQTCVAPDYMLVEDKVYEEVIEVLKEVYKGLFPEINEDSDFTHIVDSTAFKRLSGYLQKTKGKVLLGGNVKAASRFIGPTIVVDVKFSDILMEGELFGPILPIIKYSDLEDVVSTVKASHDTPLAVYIFSDSKAEQQLIKSIRSGGLMINDTLMHAGCYSTPFGGVGQSGYGNYHGKYSISTYTHQRVVMKQPYYAEALIADRYFPYNGKKLSKLMLFTKLPAFPSISLQTTLLLTLTLAVGIVIGLFL